jgi:hypothetical protein
MKISLLISGHPIVYEECYESIKKNVDLDNVDVYAHTWWDDSYRNKCYKMHFTEKFGDENLSHVLENKFSVKKIKVEKSKKFDISFIKKFNPMTWGDYDFNHNWIPMSLDYYRMMTPILLLSVLSQTYTAYQSYQLSNLQEYDVCIKSRNDILFTKSLKNLIENLDLSDNNIYFQSSTTGGHLYAGEFPDKPCDWFFVGSPKAVGLFLKKWHESVSIEYTHGIIHTNEYVKKVCNQNNLDMKLVDFGALIFKQTNDYYQKYLNRIEVYYENFDFVNYKPKNLEIWPYWITDVDFEQTKNLNF